MSLDWKKLVRSVAPALGTALGGPLAGAATKYIAEKFLGDSEATEKEISDYLSTVSPEQLLKLKELDSSFQIRMAELGIDLAKVDVENTQGARNYRSKMAEILAAMGKRDFMPDILALIAVIGFIGLLYGMCFASNGIEASVKTVVDVLAGGLAKVVYDIYNFHFGSSSSSRAKDKVLIGGFNNNNSREVQKS